jgi:hypothetical protein
LDKEQSFMAKTTTITIETNASVVIRAEGLVGRWCAGCGAEDEMIVPDDLGAVPGLDLRLVERLLGLRELHRSAGVFGSLAICLNLLLACLAGGKPAERGLAQANKETK